jgi:histidyl-tRNA synthetase
MAGKDDRVTPRTFKGCQDLLPEEAIARRAVITTIEAVFAKYGFVPLETPALEHLEVLLGTGGEETNKELFRLESPEQEPIALRFDLTVPFARLLAQYPDKLKPPFRRYAIGPVWRADKPGPGRFRQFTQCDIDAAGADSTAVDAEMVAAICDIFESLGTPSFRVLINNRKLVDALLESCGIDEDARHKHVLRVIDKLQKVGVDNVRRELGEGRIDNSGDPIPGVHLTDETIERILAFIAVKGETRAEVLEKLAGLLPDSEATAKAIAEMRELDENLAALRVGEKEAPFDPSLARGLDYYTGPVFEITLPDATEFGSVGGGGRYNELVQRFLNRPVPGTGISIGLDRLVAALTHLGVLKLTPSTVQALVVTMGKVPPAETLRVAAELRAAGVRTEAFFASRKKMGMGNQLSHADHYDIPVAVILGEDEIAQGVVAIKDLRAGKEQREGIEDRDEYRKAGTAAQVTVPRAEMVRTVQQLLDA